MASGEERCQSINDSPFAIHVYFVVASKGFSVSRHGKGIMNNDFFLACSSEEFSSCLLVLLSASDVHVHLGIYSSIFCLVLVVCCMTSG